MDLTSIVIAVLTGGSISGIVAAVVYRRENKRLKESEAKTAEMGAKQSEAEALIKYGSAMEQLLKNMEDQQKSFEKSMAEKDIIIEQQKHLIEQYRTELDNVKEESNKKIKELDLIVSENKRVITGMQKTLNFEISNKINAENSICLVDDCALRTPPRGTYKNESA